jgi:hypothetical protein
MFVNIIGQWSVQVSNVFIKIKQKVSLKIYIKNLNLKDINNSVNKKRWL